MLNIKFVAIAIVALLFATANAQDCSKDKPCEDGSCCSQWGYCGNTTEYCGDGCLATCTLTISTNAECGSIQSTKCPGSECCSQWGWCGTTDEYCGVGCQAGFGTCGADAALPVSTDYQCGTGVGAKCGESLCCSQYGWCGSTSEYCDAGCQSSFGKCNSADGNSVAANSVDGDSVDGEEVCDTDDVATVSVADVAPVAETSTTAVEVPTETYSETY